MRKSDVNNLEQLELYYNKARKIKFNKDYKIKSIDDIRQLFFCDCKKTVYTRNGHHCDNNKYRSFNDFFLICKYYFPEKTISEISKEFINKETELEKEKKPSLYMRYCPNIKKTNIAGLYPYGYDKTKIKYKSTAKIEFGFPIRFSFEEIIDN